MSISIVTRPPRRIRQNLIGLRRLLELGLGFTVVRIAIGMVLHRQAAVGRLQLDGLHLANDAQYFVVVTLFCHGKASTYGVLGALSIGTGHDRRGWLRFSEGRPAPMRTHLVVYPA